MKSVHQVLAFAVLGYGVSLAAFGLFGAPAAPVPAGITKVELGRLLFWDPVLSGERDVACATCHHPAFAYADGRELSLGPRSTGLGPRRLDGSGGEIPIVRRNSPTLLNVAYNGLDGTGEGRRGRGGRRNGDFGVLPENVEALNQARAPMFWDNRARSLEAQALGPIASREEMRGDAYAENDAVAAVVARLRQIPEYVDKFRDVFGRDTEIDAPQLAGAVAAFQRTLIARNSPFDRYLAGNQSALTAAQRRGLDAFIRANCADCHSGPMLSDFDLHAEGVREHPALAAPDSGDGRFRFRTPTLRNIALTAPYMHNGTLATLEDVLQFYNRGVSENPHVANGGGGGRGGGNGRPVLDREFRGVREMSAAEQADIVAFLHALTDENFDRSAPGRVPSGLTPGGNLLGRPATREAVRK